MDPQLAQFFNAVDVDRSGRINAMELQQVLQSSNGKKFSEEACRLMIGLFDPSNTGSIDIHGFSQLYTYINQWLQTFKSYDHNGSGFVDEGELGQALGTMGYRFGPGFVGFLVRRFCDRSNPGAGIPVDGFITACVLIHKFTEGFRKKDLGQTGVIQIQYEEFLQVVMENWC